LGANWLTLPGKLPPDTLNGAFAPAAEGARGECIDRKTGDSVPAPAPAAAP